MINQVELIKIIEDEKATQYPKLINYLKSTKELYLDSGELRFSTFWYLARANALLQNNIESKRNYYKASKIAIEFYKIYRENRYPNLLKHKYPPFSYVGSMIAVILCDNESLFKEYAQTIDYLEPKGVASPVRYHFTYALKYLFLKDFKECNKHLQEIHHEKYFQLHFKGFSHIVKGILENDIDLINEGLSYRIKYHKRENPKDSLFHAYSIEATALAKLAKLYGFESDVNSPFIHKGLLEKTEGIVYEGIEEITNALEEANRRAGALEAKISRWFKR